MFQDHTSWIERPQPGVILLTREKLLVALKARFPSPREANINLTHIIRHYNMVSNEQSSIYICKCKFLDIKSNMASVSRTHNYLLRYKMLIIEWHVCFKFIIVEINMICGIICLLHNVPFKTDIINFYQ